MVGNPGAMDQRALLTARASGAAVVAAVVVVVAGLVLTALARDGAPSTAVAARKTGKPGGCPAAAHRNLGATGLNPEAIPKLPPDFSFFQTAEDGCSPVRWNPCEPIHYIINPTDAPPTGLADVREAFRRLAEASGMTYVDDGITDEVSTGDRAYQPERYGERWAPILIHWERDERSGGDTQIVGGGLPTWVADVYVSGDLFLNPAAVVDQASRAGVPGGFDDRVTAGAIGPQGVTWGRVILHELAHITGLGHVRDPSQLMYPETTEQTGPTGFQEGDLAGIKVLGMEAGCLRTPAPAAQASRQATAEAHPAAGSP